MSELPQNKHEITQFLSHEQFVIDTCSQINKDLTGLSEFTPEFDIVLEGDVLVQVVKELALCLVRMNASMLQQFIYRVDVKEREFHHALTKEDDYQELAFLVVRREAQKVFLRHKFSQ